MKIKIIFLVTSLYWSFGQTMAQKVDFVVKLVTQDAVKDGYISKPALLVTNGLYAYANGYCSEATKTSIAMVHIVGVRNTEPLFDLRCMSGAFSEEIMKSFDKMISGDKLFISAQLRSSANNVLQVKTINLTIK